MILMSRSSLHHDALLGRPRNEEAAYTITSASIDLYGEVGWSGFNFSRVATAAGVGKSSIYLRWACREDLLLDAFRHLVSIPEISGTTPREILENWACVRTEMYVGAHAQAVRRILVEICTAEPAIISVHDYLYRTPITTLRTALWKFKENGELPRTMSITRLIDAIDGSVLMRGFSIPSEHTPCFLTEIREYVELLVEDQLGTPLRRGHLKAAS